MKHTLLKLMATVMLTFPALQAMAEVEAYNLNPTVSPKNLSEVERGAKVTLDFGDVQVSNPYNVPVTAIAQYDESDGEPETLRLDVDSDGTIFFNFDVTAEAGTQYKLSIVRGAITSADGTRANMAKSWYYFVVDAPESEEGQFKLLSVDPESGSTITPGTVINLFFSEDADIETCTDAVTITNLETGAENKVTLDWNWNNFDFSNLQFTMPKGLADGNYTATIAADLISGSYCFEKYGEITLNYTVAAQGGSTPSEPTPVEVKNFAPASSEVQTLSNIINVGFKQQLGSLAEGAVAVLKNTETDKTYTGTMTILENVEKTIKIEFDYAEDANSDKYLCVPGTYTLTIAAGTIIGKDGGTNAEITNTWTVIGVINLNDIEYTSVLPRDGKTLPALSSILITFPQTPALIKNSQAKINIGGIDYDFTLESNVVSVEINPEITAEGTYVVTLPEGAVYTLENGHGNKAVQLTYTVSDETSVAALLTDGNLTATVYNGQGVCILRNATAADLCSLPAGFYIINGKKYIKK